VILAHCRAVSEPDPTAPESELGFYEQLEQFESFIGVVAERHYVPAPGSWLLVITDVAGSTKAIEAERYKDVNAVGVASIVAVKNALRGVAFPYIFGGDGATILVPRLALPQIAEALHGVAQTSQRVFGLTLRLGAVPVAELRDAGFPVKVARFRVSEHASFAMLSGSGLGEAERRIKDPTISDRYALPHTDRADADLEGFECRWQPVPSQRGLVVSILIQAIARDEAARTDIYRRVLNELERLTHGLESSAPLHSRGLKFSLGFSRKDQEARLFAEQVDGWPYWKRRFEICYYVLLGWLAIFFGVRLGTFDGKQYRDEMIRNSDYRKFDGTVRMVLDLSQAQYQALREMLEAERGQGSLAYGLHTADSSLMTCVISSYSGNHVHFIDGSDGGYALAARELKAQLKKHG
jgi:hypothetical protein